MIERNFDFHHNSPKNVNRYRYKRTCFMLGAQSLVSRPQMGQKRANCDACF